MCDYICMKAPLQNEILDFLKQRLLPEIGEIRKDLDAFRVETQAEFKVIKGRLDEMDRRFDQMDRRMDLMTGEIHELKGEVREVRSYVFTSRMGETHYAVREKSTR